MRAVAIGSLLALARCMDVRKVLAILCLAGVSAGDSPLFSTKTTLDLTLKAPLKELFQQGSDNDKFAAQGELAYRDPNSGAAVVVSGVEVSVRGHTSRRGSECPFPKLKVAFGKKDGTHGESIFGGLDGLRIGTHCGESEGEQLTPEFGRLANEKSPLREAFVYHLLDAIGVPTLRARPARIAYVDTTGGEQRPVVRNALLLEDDDDVKRRVGATGAITMEQFTTAGELFAPADTARLAFAEAMIGNFDWCLRFYADDTYRCDAKQPLWNISAFKRNDGRALPVIADFDLAGMVVGSHNWFDQVYFAGFVPSRSSIEIEVLSPLQRTRALFSRAQLDDTRRYFLSPNRPPTAPSSRVHSTRAVASSPGSTSTHFFATWRTRRSTGPSSLGERRFMLTPPGLARPALPATWRQPALQSTSSVPKARWRRWRSSMCSGSGRHRDSARR